VLRVHLSDNRVIYADSKTATPTHISYYRDHIGLIAVVPIKEVVYESEAPAPELKSVHPDRRA
jgi:hypothetical protein